MHPFVIQKRAQFWASVCPIQSVSVAYNEIEIPDTTELGMEEMYGDEGKFEIQEDGTRKVVRNVEEGKPDKTALTQADRT